MVRLFLACVVLGSFAYAQVEARFDLPKKKYLAGEPVLLEYAVHNAGAQPITILAATPNSFCSGYAVKVNRTDVTEKRGCGGGYGGSCASSSRTLEPGGISTEHYLVNDGTEMRSPGSYHINATRVLPTSPDPDLTKLHLGPTVTTSAEFDVEVVAGDAQQVRNILQPYFSTLGTNDWPRRNMASLVVTMLSSPAVEDLVLQLRESPRTKEIAIPALSSTNTPATRKQLAEIAASTAEDRFSAASALGWSGDRSYWPLLHELAARQPREQADAFITAAATLGGDDAVPWLRDLLRSPDTKSRAGAIYPLALTGSRQAIPVLIDMIGDPDANIQTSAQSALVQLTHHAFNPKQIVPSDSAAAHAAWIRWWSRNAESAPIYKPGEYCGNAAPLN